MIRSAFLLCATAIVATCFACAPVTSAPPPPPPSSQALACDASTFLSKVSYLPSMFAPGPGITAPTGVSLPGGSTYAADLTQAFGLASDAFKRQLCALDAVYVQGTSCTSLEQCADESWGWWQTSNKLGGGRIVGLSAALWQYATQAPPIANQGPYSAYETNVMNAVIAVDGAYYLGAATCGGGSCTSVDTFPMTLLAALAHEVGHILWYDKVTTYLGGGKFSPPHNPCTDGTNFFLGWSKIGTPPNWRTFLTPPERQRLWGPSSNWPNKHANPPHIRDIDGSSNRPFRALQTARLLGTNQVWASPPQPWASVFGAVSPDEDFVETYKFKVLTTATTPLQSVTITIPSPTGVNYFANVADDYTRGLKPDLKAKVTCMPDSFF